MPTLRGILSRMKHLVGMVGALLAIVVGALVGIGGFTFVYAEGGSYLSNDAAACANCHVMQTHYDGWTRSSHHAVATCNDCHTPHDFFGKWITKARNGYHHSMAFTLGGFPEPIRITPVNREITEQACRYCHAEMTQQIDHLAPGGEEMSCIRCHAGVGH
ncbi:MAG: cytochrome c nitrite reductase small subunit [Phycisphaerae bacterium]